MKEKNFSQPRVSLQQKIALVFLGLFLSLALLEVGLRLGGFVLLSIQEYGNLKSIKQKGAYRILCLGESTTQGQYPHLLEQVLNQRNVGVRFSVIDEGKTGTETVSILSHVEAYLAEYHPDMVIAMMGVNDWGKHIPFEAATVSGETSFVRLFKVYKLMRFLELHLLAKAKEMGFYKPDEERRSSGEAQTPVPKTGLKKISAKAVSKKGSSKKAVEPGSQKDKAFVELGKLYRGQGKHQQAEDAFKQAVEINPESDDAYAELGRLYAFQGRAFRAQDSPQSGWIEQSQGKFLQAEIMFKKAIEIDPENHGTLFDFGVFYRDQGKLPQAENSFRRAVEIAPEDPLILGAMASLYEEMGRLELAKEYAKKEADQLRSEDRVAATDNNYRKLKEILDRKRIKLVCVQYPVREVESLKKIFEKNKDIIFVDNERIFKEAVKRSSYKEYFLDMFGGDFGHCTPKGNMLLAQNIADVILRDVFKK
jgi:tetratricopeptide (TPR) repeat protein